MERLGKGIGRKIGLVGLLLLFLWGCTVSLLDQAWQGNLNPQDGNQIIISYCQSCHIHKDIPNNQCLEEKPVLYDRPPYKTATECWICHFVESNSWSLYQENRHTRRPEEVKQGQYKDFEKKASKEIESRRQKQKDDKGPSQLSQQRP
ncbi:MAG: hypothetical protein HYY20_04200 [Candidatus Tectomicrobia bacterium]|uniref:Uncharacterized protein n=1 Tax=Tectimicrobiota bacterium TaxID=2528274 RepID=A0A932CN09_UNCTE|nr:hypothetical protein [Candidatus Tectomicrobia bacterium]